ncbi:MAG: biopolymer transporter ExbD [Chitinophagales bacterium]|nr:biopolymer transporter ExbD [Chitinophagales bacterium]MDW8418940.1 biopolymer transporter ExbD [Chitinophagales bacterium]
MADIDTSASGAAGGKHSGGPRAKKMSTRVDLTPMVDLAFLLISFFMLTTTLNKPKAMELNMPKKVEDEELKQEVGDCQVLNILLDTLDQVWYYEGLKVAGLQKTTFAGDEGIRKVIMNMMKKVPKECPKVRKWEDKNGDKQKQENEFYMGDRDAIVLIKMLKGARYKNMVDILDEMDITDCKIYAIQDPDPIEVEAVMNGGVVKEFAKE